MEFHTNQLRMDELDRDLLRRWQDSVAERAADFVLGEWDGAYPDDELPAIAALNDVMNSAPRDDLDVEDEHFSPEQLRQFEQSTFATGTQRWTLYVRHRTTRAFAGFTEVFWNPRQPQLLHQGGTGVFPEYRNCGLGRLLKAAMLTKILKEHPEIKFVRTGNADSNVPMLRINTELGFKPYMRQCVWQVDVSHVMSLLA
jgi:RimJ/RimL family protein N-acetyltransferase